MPRSVSPCTAAAPVDEMTVIGAFRAEDGSEEAFKYTGCNCTGLAQKVPIKAGTPWVKIDRERQELLRRTLTAVNVLSEDHYAVCADSTAELSCPTLFGARKKNFSASFAGNIPDNLRCILYFCHSVPPCL